VNDVLVGRVGLSPVMVGRSDPLDRLSDLLEAAEIGGGDLPIVALVSGEAGIGKTRLLREFAGRVPADVPVLTAQAQPGSIGRSYHAVAQLAPGSDAATAPLDAVQRAAEAGRAVLLVEDLHWADAESVAVLDAITQSPWPHLMVIGTYRPADLTRGSPGGELLLRLERRHAVEQVRLDRLDRADVGAMLASIVGRPPGSAAVEAVHRRSAGIPFVVEELVRAAPDDCLDDLASARLPWSLDEAVRQQVAGLAPGERCVVEALAVFGRPTSFDALSSVTSLDERELLDALRPLVVRGVIVEPSEDLFWFDHALVAEVVVDQLLGRERRQLHERAAEVLRTHPTPDAAALAFHLHGAGRYDEAVEVARGGARADLERGASFQALRLAVLALAEEPDDLELLAVATEAAWRLDFNDEALKYAKRWVERAPGGTDAVDALRLLGRLYVELGMDDERDATMARMEQLAATMPPGRERARLHGALAQISMLSWRGLEAVRWADLAIAEAEALGDEYVATQASIERGSALNAIADAASAKAALVAAVERARRLGDGVLEARGLNNMLEFVPLQGPEARELLDALYRLTDRLGFDKLGRDARHWELWVTESRGDLAGLRRAVDELLPEWSHPRRAKDQSPRTDVLAFIALEEGRVADARRLLDTMAPAHEANCRGNQHSYLAKLTMLGALTGDAELAASALDRLRQCAEPVRDDTFVVNHMVTLVDAALCAGIDPGSLTDVVEATVMPAAVARVKRHTDGLLLAADGRTPEAIAALDETLRHPDASMALPARATLRLALATALLAAGDRDRAREQARIARDTELGSWPGWRRDRTEALLRRLEGPRRLDGVLTPREREVASLIAEGLTNGQLAERLYISPKTAAVHVSNILTKLGLSGRAEVAAWAVRNGLVPSAA
jgi:DNA-binding CsgD family transcriptional regulator/tetratricopeptide (TPR) repeat protein